jgi:hypothetical protein
MMGVAPRCGFAVAGAPDGTSTSHDRAAFGPVSLPVDRRWETESRTATEKRKKVETPEDTQEGRHKARDRISAWQRGLRGESSHVSIDQQVRSEADSELESIRPCDS